MGLETGEGYHPSGLLLDSIVGINVVANVAGGGEGQQFHSHADHGVGEGKREQLATVGDGFKTEFRKITRARRRYCGGPDGRVQACLTDLGFSGDDKCFQNLGGKEIPNLECDKKRKVEREPSRFSKRTQLS